MTGGVCGVAGWGAVTPNGWAMPAGVAENGVQAGALMSGPGRTAPVLRVAETGPFWERWKREARLRRAGAIARFTAAAVEGALRGSVAAPGRRGLIGVFATGPLVFSRRFFEGTQAAGGGLASPALFPETVYNSPLSHAAAILGFGGPVYTLVGDESAWVAACDTAALWLERGDAAEVVVVAADEADEVTQEAFDVAGWFRRPGFVAGEGAGALRLAPAQPDLPRLEVACLPRPHNGRAGARQAAAALVAEWDPQIPVLATGRGLWWGPVEAAALEGRRVIELSAGCAGAGVALSAGPVWAAIDGLRRRGEEMPARGWMQPVWGLNHAVAAVRWGG